MDNAKCPHLLGVFCRLPPELRQEIYIHYVYEPQGYSHNPVTNKLCTADKRPVDLNLMYTCKQIAAEMHGLALQTNLITFRTFIPEEGTPRASIRAARFDDFMTTRILLAQQYITAAVLPLQATHLGHESHQEFMHKNYPISMLAQAIQEADRTYDMTQFAQCLRDGKDWRSHDAHLFPDGKACMTRLYFADQIDISPCYALEMLKERYTNRSAQWTEDTFGIIANDLRNATSYMRDVYNYDLGHQFVTGQFKSPAHIAAFMHNAIDPWSVPTEAELEAVQDSTGHEGQLYLDPQPRDAGNSLLTLFASFGPALTRRTM
jgi:hypothetical protein